MPDRELREAIILHAQALNSSGLTTGNSGNISARYNDGLLITPTGVPYQQLQPEDIVTLDLQGNVVNSKLLPSSEWHFHCAIYNTRPEIHAVVHTHSLHCTALACTGRGIPAFHYMVAEAGGDTIRCAPYATFGTMELAELAVTALTDRLACLLANHGSLTIGKNLEKAFSLALAIEQLAAQYCEVIKIGGEQRLDEKQMAEVIQKFCHYGQQPKPPQ